MLCADFWEHSVFSIFIGGVILSCSHFWILWSDFWEHPVFSISVGGVILFLLTLLNVMCRLLGTLCLFHFHRWCNSFLFTLLNCTCGNVWEHTCLLHFSSSFLLTPPMKMEQTGCFETSANKIEDAGDSPKKINSIFRTRREFEMNN